MKLLAPTTLALALAAVASVAVVACESSPPWLTMPSRAEHASRFFPATPGTPHGELACEDCHGTTESFRHFDCIDCHLGEHANEAEVTLSHQGITDFRWESAACYGCHRDGIGVDHEPIFPIETGDHATAACAECHIQPGDRSVLGCAGCHGHEQAEMAAQHSGEPGYTFVSRECLRCHPRGVREED